MIGFWALARKEAEEQRGTWKFLALVGGFTALALLVSIIPFIVSEVKDEPQGVLEARDVLRVFGFTIVGLGTLLTIIVAMGSLAGERASGTAAMTLSKPVSRSAFVSTKFLGLATSILAALAIASAVMYVLTLVLIDDGGLAGFARYMAIIGVYLVFIGSIAFFWSGMFLRQLLAGGIALVLFIVMQPLSAIPHTQRYWPISTIEWAESSFSELEEQSPIDEIIVLPGSVSEVRGGEKRATRVEPVNVEDGPVGSMTYQRFQQLRVELADIEDIDGLTPRVVGSKSARNPESRRREGVKVFGLDPLHLEGFGGFTFTSGGEARLEDLADDQVYISEDAAKHLDAEAGDRLLLADHTVNLLPSDDSGSNIPVGEKVSEKEVSVDVRGVVNPSGLLGSTKGLGASEGLSDAIAIIVPFQHAQTRLRSDDQISHILVSNRGENSGSGLSEEVTSKLRARFADREAVSQIKELLGQGTVLKALKRVNEDLDGNLREDLSRLREELQREGISDEFISLLAEPNLGLIVMQALDRDGLDDVLQEAAPLFADQAEFTVLDLNRRPLNEASDYWPAFAIAFGSIVLLSVGAWGVFRKKEL